MYHYKLINNHYVIDIGGSSFLLDTGSPSSFWVSRPMREVVIDGNRYPLGSKPSNLDVAKMEKVIGVVVDGFIGCDILFQTALTIHKDGWLDFASREVGGTKMPMSNHWPLKIRIEGETFVVDTGARYGYCLPRVFAGSKPLDHVWDYNPSLGELESDIYALKLRVGDKQCEFQACDNDNVTATVLAFYGATMIGSIATFFNEACVLDLKRGQLTLN